MPQILFTWLLFFSLCLFLGSWTEKRIIKKYFVYAAEPSVWLLFWTGVAVLYVILSLVTFFTPLDSVAKPTLWFAFSGFIWFEKTIFMALLIRFKSGLKHFGWVAWLAFSLTAFMALLKSAGVPEVFDEGAYHLPLIRMWEQQGIVPGFANLNAHYGLHSSWHILSAFSNLSFLPGFVSEMCLNGLLAVFLALFSASRLQHLQDGKVITLSGFAAIFLPFFLFRNLLSSPNTDVPAITGAWFFFLLLLERIEKKQDLITSPALFLILPVFLVILKASSAGLLFAPAAFFILRWINNERKGLIFSILVAIGLPLGIWILQNWLLSGYLIYPLEFTALGSPDWQVPPENMQKKFYSEQFGAFAPPAVYNLQWLRSWFSAHNTDSRLIILLASMFFIAFPFVLQRVKKTAAFRRDMIVFYLLLLLPAVIWLFSVTEPRYGFGTLVIAALFVPGFLIVGIQRKLPVVWPFPVLIIPLMALNCRKSLAEFEGQGRPFLIPEAVPQVTYRSLQCGNFTANCPQQYKTPVPSGKPVFCWDCPFPCFPLEGITDSAFVFEDKMAWFTTFYFQKKSKP
jgi:hypothetical protein